MKAVQHRDTEGRTITLFFFFAFSLHLSVAVVERFRLEVDC
jgi:hypothetical protein